MTDDSKTAIAQTPEGFKEGLTIEHVMLSVTIVSTKESAGQFDDSIAHQIRKQMAKYCSVISVTPEVLYKHTKIEKHIGGCKCGYCQPFAPERGLD